MSSLSFWIHKCVHDEILRMSKITDYDDDLETSENKTVDIARLILAFDNSAGPILNLGTKFSQFCYKFSKEQKERLIDSMYLATETVLAKLSQTNTFEYPVTVHDLSQEISMYSSKLMSSCDPRPPSWKPILSHFSQFQSANGNSNNNNNNNGGGGEHKIFYYDNKGNNHQRRRQRNEDDYSFASSFFFFVIIIILIFSLSSAYFPDYRKTKEQTSRPKTRLGLSPQVYIQ